MWLLLPTRLSRSRSERSRRLEKLHDVPAPVLDQDLFPARARNDLVSKRNAVPLHDPDPRLEVRDLHHEAIPSPCREPTRAAGSRDAILAANRTRPIRTRKVKIARRRRIKNRNMNLPRAGRDDRRA